MPQGNAYLKNFAARKQLLIVESELNRRLLLEDGRVLARELRALRDQAAQWQGVVGVGVALVSALRSKKDEAPSSKKRSWVTPIVETVRLGASLWTAFRDGKERKET